MVLQSFETRRRNVFPMAIGRIPPSFFLKAQRLAPKTIGHNVDGIALLNIVLANSVKELTSFDPAAPVCKPTISLRYWARRPSIPSAEPEGKEKIAFRLSSLQVWKGAEFKLEKGTEEKDWEEAVGCLRRRDSRVEASKGAKNSSEERILTAPEMSPSSNFQIARLA